MQFHNINTNQVCKHVYVFFFMNFILKREHDSAVIPNKLRQTNEVIQIDLPGVSIVFLWLSSRDITAIKTFFT